MDETYKGTLEIARTELENLLAEESQLESQLQSNRTRQVGLKKTIESLGALIGEDPDDTITGISDAIRSLLSEHANSGKKTGYLPTGIRDRLLASGFDLDGYKNPMAVIHTTLKRLQEQGEIEAFDTKEKKTAYRWTEQSIGITDDDVPF